MKKRYYTPKRYSFTLRLDKKTIWTGQELMQLSPTKFSAVVEKLGAEYTFFKQVPTVKYGATSIEEVYRAQQGDQKVRNKIINDNIPLLVKILNSLLPTIGIQKNSYEWDEFIQLGRVALDRAIESFDTAGDTAFSTWAHIAVRNEYISYWKVLKKQWEREVSLSTPIGAEEEDEGRLKVLEDILEDPKVHITHNLELAQYLEDIKRLLSPVAWEIFKAKMEEKSGKDIEVILKEKGFRTQRGTEYTMNNISEILYNSIKPVLEKVFGRKLGSVQTFAEGEIDLAGVEDLLSKLRDLIFQEVKKEPVEV